MSFKEWYKSNDSFFNNKEDFRIHADRYPGNSRICFTASWTNNKLNKYFKKEYSTTDFVEIDYAMYNQIVKKFIKDIKLYCNKIGE